MKNQLEDQIRNLLRRRQNWDYSIWYFYQLLLFLFMKWCKIALFHYQVTDFLNLVEDHKSYLNFQLRWLLKLHVGEYPQGLDNSSDLMVRICKGIFVLSLIALSIWCSGKFRLESQVELGVAKMEYWMSNQKQREAIRNC